MKKSVIILFMTAMVCFVMVGCGNDTELRWKNDSSSAVNTIQWMNSGDVDQTWNDTTALSDGSTNDFKKVEKLNGEGQCLSGDVVGGGALSDIHVNGTNDSYAELAEGESQTLTISGLAKK